MIDREKVEREFARYVSAYDADSPKIQLKIRHTLCVAALCERIAREIGADDPDLAWLCGMLHDIGRFEQVRRYNTFVDALSVDHARLGADLLFRKGLLERFVPDLPEHGRRLLECSIRNHSAYRISAGLSESEIQYCDILRDADKIDIFRADCETPFEDIFNVTTQALKSAAVSEEVRSCFENRTAVPRGLKRTPADIVVSHICLYFELVYPISRQIAREQGCLDRLLSFVSENPDTNAWFAHMRDSIRESCPAEG
jgi:uncharacterized domain HDIG